MVRKYNFSAGPSTLPLSVLQELQRTLVEHNGAGLSLIEASHRSKEYEAVHNSAISLFRELLAVPRTHEILLLGGGATLQFAMVPLNFLLSGSSCDLAHSGAWARKALEDARKVGSVRLAFDGSASSFMTLPTRQELSLDPDAAYFHLTSNETIGGVQWKEFPDTGAVPIVADMSSDIMSRPISFDRFGLIYAGAQKNLGPAGVTVVIIRKDMLDRCPDTLPAYLSYKVHAESNSLYNTPPVFSINAMRLVLQWVKEEGGLAECDRRAHSKSATLYDAIEGSDGFYRNPVDPRCRSTMNVVFRLPTEELEKRFVSEATAAGLDGLKGHRSVGGCRASIYNAMPTEGVAALAEFMSDFASKHRQ
ncbi:MAG: 3-phosphoserine/phosphohydroxythreonine transaminase [Spirochaetaceae bacterium]|nr:MAG: 3-phosphoserine/phosphohydroxythreonine transaminase [Spirochaetaceae bacterium]